MKYFLDTEFIERPCTIDLISIGLVAEDGREYYAISTEFKKRKASEWVKNNVINHLPARYANPMYASSREREGARAWKSRALIRDDILAFCDPAKYGKPEFWGYYCDYDWVCMAWLFGTMMDLPEQYPMYCRDLKQWIDAVGSPKIPVEQENEHNALADARWNKAVYGWLAEEFGPWGQ